MSTLRAGFSLLELLVAISILAVLVALMTPTLAGLIQSDEVTTTQKDAERIYRAMFGTPSRGELGFIGDMGRLPAANTLSELVSGTGLTPFHTSGQPGDASLPGGSHVGSVGTGWRGPYLRSLFSTSDLFRDAWGLPFSYSTGNGQVTSGGPDGDLATTADNITFPILAPLTTGTLFVSVFANGVVDAQGATAKLYSPVNGEQTVTPTKKRLPADTAFDGFSFPSVTHGLHALVVAHTGRDASSVCVTVSRTVPVAVLGGQNVVVEVQMSTTAIVSVTANTCTIPD